MALVSFGATARGHNAVALVNTTNTNLSFGILHGGRVIPAGTKYFTFNVLDELMQSCNQRNNDLYTVNSDGVTPFLNDVAELAALLVAGKLVAYSATFVPSTGVFTTGSALASASYVDGTVAFS